MEKPAFVSDMRGLISFDLEDDELDAAHFTIFWHGEGWVASFDFRAGRSKSTDTLAAAVEFLEAARLSAERETPDPVWIASLARVNSYRKPILSCSVIPRPDRRSIEL